MARSTILDNLTAHLERDTRKTERKRVTYRLKLHFSGEQSQGKVHICHKNNKCNQKKKGGNKNNKIAKTK